MGAKVRWERRAQALTQEDLAKRAGVSVATLTRIEQGQVEPHVSTLRRLADALGVEPRDLMEDRPRVPAGR